MGNCFSKRPQDQTSLEAISTAPQTMSTSPQTLSTSPQTTQPTEAGHLSMFNKAQNIRIKGGSFNNRIHMNPTSGPSLDALFGRVARNAILNAGGRADEVRCHPGTREEVIDRIEKWADAPLDDLAAPIFWLSGPAGAGKSAIMQTIAERCKERGVPQANFFFFRADNSRSDASPLIPTLLYQLILLYPSLRDFVATVLSTDPLIFNAPLEDQLAHLIVTPLLSIQQSVSPHRPLLLLIDGLDECDSENKRSQGQILRAFDAILKQHRQSSPFRLLVASRDESHIQAAFNRISLACVRLYLDDQYFPENDIRVFINDKFVELRETHPLARTLAMTWPSTEDVNYIVDKSSGHFIYAATVMRFISDSSASPKLSLERVKGAAQLATNSKSPFSHLDAIYTYILTQVEDQEAAKDLLHAQLLITNLAKLSSKIFVPASKIGELPLTDVLRLYNPRYTEDIVFSCFADLTSIAQYNPPQDSQLLFYHASFSDYLLDHSRSGKYFVNLAVFSGKISLLAWEGIQKQDLTGTVWEHIGILTLPELQKFPPGLLDMLASSKQGWCDIRSKPQPPILNIIYEQCITDHDINNFKYIIRQWMEAFSIQAYTFDDFPNVPFADRYFHMAYAAQLLKAPDVKIMAALSPSSDYDSQESSIWLNDLLHSIHEKIYPNDPERYHQLLQAWISWANENHIACDSLEDLLNAQNCIQPKK